MLEKLFRLREHNTTVRTEVIAGITTFLSMAYIIFVQPAVMSQAGMDFNSVMVATCLSAAVACIVMALVANYPIALAPGMGENFFFTFAVVLGMGVAWQTALGVVFMSGVLFLLLTVLRIREQIVNAIPDSLKIAIPAAIGIFISFIGLTQAGIVIKDPGGGIVTLGNLAHPPTLLSIIGLFIILFFMARKAKGALLIGMIITAVIGLFMGVVQFNGVVAPPPSLEPTFLKLDILAVFDISLISVVIVFLIMDMFDTIGTLIGVAQASGLMKNGELPRAHRALFADAAGTITGALLGTSTVTSYVESTTGVREGGRTGLTALVVAALMLLSIFFSPLVGMVGGGIPLTDADGNLITMLYPVTAPALILVGAFMAKVLGRMQWDDITETVPAFMTIVGMAFTFNISNGLAFGFILYPVMKVMAGRHREASPLMYGLAVVFVLKFVLMLGG